MRPKYTEASILSPLQRTAPAVAELGVVRPRLASTVNQEPQYEDFDFNAKDHLEGILRCGTSILSRVVASRQRHSSASGAARQAAPSQEHRTRLQALCGRSWRQLSVEFAAACSLIHSRRPIHRNSISRWITPARLRVFRRHRHSSTRVGAHSDSTRTTGRLRSYRLFRHERHDSADFQRPMNARPRRRCTARPSSPGRCPRPVRA